MKTIRARTSLKQKAPRRNYPSAWEGSFNCSGAAGAYVPRAVLASLKGRSGGRDAKRWAGETVSCCCVFMDLGLDSDTLKGRLMTTPWRVHGPSPRPVYEYEGAVNKFLHDDKGSTLIACWGRRLPADDATPCPAALAA